MCKCVKGVNLSAALPLRKKQTYLRQNTALQASCNKSSSENTPRPRISPLWVSRNKVCWPGSCMRIWTASVCVSRAGRGTPGISLSHERLSASASSRRPFTGLLSLRRAQPEVKSRGHSLRIKAFSHWPLGVAVKTTLFRFINPLILCVYQDLHLLDAAISVLVHHTHKTSLIIESKKVLEDKRVQKMYG